jgi:hypothetical protein
LEVSIPPISTTASLTRRQSAGANDRLPPADQTLDAPSSEQDLPDELLGASGVVQMPAVLYRVTACARRTPLVSRAGVTPKGACCVERVASSGIGARLLLRDGGASCGALPH